MQLDTAGLSVALQDLASSIEQMFQVRCHVTCDQPVVPVDDPTVLIHLYRITQEAISNAIRHGRARNVYVDLVHAGERTLLSIEDDGVGIDPVGSRVGLGMRTMRHRARLIGATLTVEPREGAGTVVSCTLERRPPLTTHAGVVSEEASDVLV
ncbi:MAG: ATP-binding protein [Actinomycetota bacterium]|nr:ATP-binding protein [Actinomycetota bacterium]